MWKMIRVILESQPGTTIAFIISVRMGRSIVKRICILKRKTEVVAFVVPTTAVAARNSGFDMLDEAFNDMSIS